MRTSVKNSGKLSLANQIIGALAISIGLIALFTPILSSALATAVSAVALFVSGLVLIVIAFKNESRKDKLVQSSTGVVAVALSVYIYVAPIPSLQVITLALLSYLLIDGFVGAYLSVRSRELRNRVLTFVYSASNLGLATFLIHEWPVSQLYSIGVFVGIRLMIAGVYTLTSELRRHQRNDAECYEVDTAAREACAQ